ncbi:uncharacterized protein LOC106176856 isoform X2 [Lingula anatina]|uniref:RBR-type E3 ubiquitin transferase n=1 Tax=Lingula anatina TaxID=7574 RepID=A0A1S3JXU0_LINAN|nr:uncharacterized protein LOC106176856 isoform X1 [Lingula anatina]XP_013414871.1 uncharacterized protein LOC106176856 isoform X2 [Lingula anatina]|eukprot:XP_013414863.1 uncharacterized protein LOC106176856 isoform X1 [Lingula anatina]
MGSSSSKFRKHLQNGDEYAALQLYESNADLRKALDPNMSYGETYQHQTPLHFAAQYAMKSLLRIFLHDLQGNPNKKNGKNQSALHLVCTINPGNPNQTRPMARQRRVDCIAMLLQWRGADLKDGQMEKVELGAQDEDKNTGLHYAASSGLKRCVEFLVNNGAPLFIENVDNETPCDCAERAGFSDIALYLESKMVFSNDMAVDENEDAAIVSIDLQEEYSGLKAQDLQEAKDQLLVETSDMLRVPLFTAEALLRNHEWSREMLLEAWMRDAIVCCEKSGVNPPSSVFEDLMAQSSEDSDTLRSVTPRHHGQSDILCDICANYIPSDETAVPMSCEHRFCRACWEGYLNVKIQEGEAHNITCPAYDCIKLVPVELIEEIVSRDMARRYLQFDIQAFVDSNPNIKWCPSPGCIRAVKLPDMDGASGVMSPVQPSIASKLPGDTSRSVDCGSGHYFCWDCLGEAHAPASCENWSKWFQKISEICPEALCDTSGAVETSANILWLVTNAKPCPNCKSPIQKNEGCNHMKCSKCKHDFCWVCLEQWKKHSSATGGYFRCNRYDVSKKVDEQTEVQKTEAEQKHMANKEMHKFVHYYTRFKNHDNSFKLEEPLLTTAKEKMLILANAVSDPATADIETKFIEDAVHQLLKARRVLKCSYVYGYYIEEVGIRKPIFEFMQTELEEATENLSQMINRPYLRTPRNKIIGQAQLVTRKRHDLIGAIARGLVPVDLSPGNSRKKYSFDVDEDTKKALLDSIQDMELPNPWVMDSSGRHTNVSALFDWPDSSPEESEDEQEEEQGEGKAGQTPSVTSDVCRRTDCSKPRARNKRTGGMHEYCSLRCLRKDRVGKEGVSSPRPSELVADYQLDLLRALEMSRLQLLRDVASLGPSADAASSSNRLNMEIPLPEPLPPRPEETAPKSPVSKVSTSPLSSSPSRTGRSINSPRLPRVVRRGTANRSERQPPAAATDVEDFDPELQRAIELSRITAEEEDTELKMAIQLSLQDSAPNSPLEASIPITCVDVHATDTPVTPVHSMHVPTLSGTEAQLILAPLTEPSLCVDEEGDMELEKSVLGSKLPGVSVYSLQESNQEPQDTKSLEIPEYTATATRNAQSNISMDPSDGSDPVDQISGDRDHNDNNNQSVLTPRDDHSSSSEKSQEEEELDTHVKMLLAYSDSIVTSSALTTSKDDSDSTAACLESPLDTRQHEEGMGGARPKHKPHQAPRHHKEGQGHAQGQGHPRESEEDPQCSGTCHGAYGNSFGLIKNISVNNILAMDVNKTKEFEKKDFSHLYSYVKTPTEDLPSAIHGEVAAASVPLQFNIDVCGAQSIGAGPPVVDPAVTTLDEWTEYLTSSAVSTSPTVHCISTYTDQVPMATTDNMDKWSVSSSSTKEMESETSPLLLNNESNLPSGSSSSGKVVIHGQNDLNRGPSSGSGERETSLWARHSANQITLTDLTQDDEDDMVYV